jgi:hypothetical protein
MAMALPSPVFKRERLSNSDVTGAAARHLLHGLQSLFLRNIFPQRKWGSRRDHVCSACAALPHLLVNE